VDSVHDLPCAPPEGDGRFGDRNAPVEMFGGVFKPRKPKLLPLE
jgi:hypothetical protein